MDLDPVPAIVRFPGPSPGALLTRLCPLLAALLVLLLGGTGLLSGLERPVNDLLQRTLRSRPAPGVAVVLIDEEALRRLGPWPWPRERLARVVDQVAAAGARGVALDLVLPEAREGDGALAASLARLPSVLAVGLDEQGRFLAPGPALGEAAHGHVSFDLDGDGVVRQFPSTRTWEGRTLPAFPVAAARLMGPGRPVPVGVTLRPAWRHRSFPVLGASEVLDGWGARHLRGRVVLLGASAAGLGDRYVTPATRGGSPEPGVLVEAAATQAFLDRDLLGRSPLLLEAALAAALGLLLAEGTGLLLAVLAFAALPLALVLLHSFGVVLEPVALAVSVLLPGSLALAQRARRERRGLVDARERLKALEALRQALPREEDGGAEARAVLAHELKTPLTSMRGLAQLLSRFDLSPEERSRVAGLVVSESTRLARMVDDLLNLERLAFRDFDREARPLDLGALVAARMEVLRTGADRPWEVRLAPGIQILGDAALLSGVVDNLVANALKFSPEGSPVRVSLAAQEGGAVLEVEDAGPGVAEKERAAIFRRFGRGSAGHLAPGLGLGLALVAEAAAWHRGRVDVGKGEAGGSVFQVRIPLAPRTRVGG